MSSNIGVNIRVTSHHDWGDRIHMEDMSSVCYKMASNGNHLEYCYFGIFDGHGGREAAEYAKYHLLDNITNQRRFWSDNDQHVLKAIKLGFLRTQNDMWKSCGKWTPKRDGRDSTAGTTASIAFIRNAKLYFGHVGDSAIVLGYQDSEVHPGPWKAKMLTNRHKPESLSEKSRIQQSGGHVALERSIPRVVWKRPERGHRGPVRRSTQMEHVPFLSVARSLGDFWSYNYDSGEFAVSPEPDVDVMDISLTNHRCLVFGTDGLFDVLDSQRAVDIVYNAETSNDTSMKERLQGKTSRKWINPSMDLVNVALGEWRKGQMRADNTSAMTVILDPPGPPREQVFLARLQKKELCSKPSNTSPSSSDRRLKASSTSNGGNTLNTRISPHRRPQEDKENYDSKLDNPDGSPSQPRDEGRKRLRGRGREQKKEEEGKKRLRSHSRPSPPSKRMRTRSQKKC